MPEIISEKIRMLAREAPHRLAQRRLVQHDLEELPSTIGAGPTRRMTSPGLVNNSVSNASMMAGHHLMLRMSTFWVTCEGTLSTASRRRSLPILIATACAPMLSRIILARLSGTICLGAASITSAAVCAAASRSLSQFSRKFAIHGT